MGNMTALRRSYTIWFNGLPIDEIDSITKSYALRVMMAIPYEYQWQEASLQALEGLNNPIRDAQVLLQLRQVKLDQFSLCLKAFFSPDTFRLCSFSHLLREAFTCIPDVVVPGVPVLWCLLPWIKTLKQQPSPVHSVRSGYASLCWARHSLIIHQLVMQPFC